ncbi:uncharacterized protein LOC132277937 [Cornus florida]|uniref:uncharacterized protein LOC132277937 n=1 Tax=Cornus florida TaxID=4283 RepID=UPI00289B5355|nr:uncharacterized protein LOC132277937 [Cornus florida]
MSITFDAITGADQSKKKLWERILEQYKQHIGVPTERNDGGLMNRWSVIQQKINKFSGCMTTIEMNRPSGFSSDDMMIAAKDLFCSQTSGEFKLESCREILKHNNKWNSHCAEQVGKGKKKKEPKKRNGFDFDINESIGHSLPSTPSSHAATTDGASTEESPHIGENDSPGVKEYQLQRPGGRKAAKQCRAKINLTNELQTSFVSKFNNITTHFESRREKMQDAQVAREVRKMEKEKTRKLEILEKQRLEEKKLMLIDPNSAPTVAGKAWIIARQNEILAYLNSPSAPKFS